MVKKLEYPVKRIRKKEEITTCTRFEVNHFQWVQGPAPKTWGFMGYLDGNGLYIEMYCEEKKPRRLCRNPEGRYSTEKGKRVCDDSAMEIFIGFPEQDGSITQDSLYVNLELNANGVMFASYGRGKQNRNLLSDELYKKAMPQAEIQEDGWKISVLIPEEFLKKMGRLLEEGDCLPKEMYCNFYKISETPEIEHYGCYGEINSEAPDFHRPQDFVKMACFQYFSSI